jgi:hypothetical protein
VELTFVTGEPPPSLVFEEVALLAAELEGPAFLTPTHGWNILD